MAYDTNPPRGKDPGQHLLLECSVTVIDVEEANEQPAFADPTCYPLHRRPVENTAAFR